MNESQAAQSAREQALRRDSANQGGLFDQIMEEGGISSDPYIRSHTRNLVKEFVNQFIVGEMTISRDATMMISGRIAQIDHLVSLQLSPILHNPMFQALESAWRGLRYVVSRTWDAPSTKIRILNAKKRELHADFRDSVDRQDAFLYRAVVLDAAETLGAPPFGVLTWNYECSNHPEDIELLERVTRVASEAFTPVVAAAAPEMFQAVDFSAVRSTPALDGQFASTEYAKWQSFRSSRRSFSEFAVLALPRILLRKPWGRRSKRVKSFEYEEGVDGTDRSALLWGNPAWAITAQLARAFETSWCADPASTPGGGVIRGLPIFEFYRDEGDTGRIGPTDAPISDSQLQRLTNLGFAAICVDAASTRAVIYDLATARKPPVLEDEDSEPVVQPPVLLSQVLIRSRIAHYIQCIAREKRNWFQSPVECERYLNAWLSRYSAGSSALFQEAELRVVKQADGPDNWFRAEGYVKLAGSDSPVQIDLSIPILLNQAAAAWSPPFNLTREVDLEPPPQTPPQTPAAGSFDLASEALARLHDLRRRGILDEAEYRELKAAALARMTHLLTSGTATPQQAVTAPKFDPGSVHFGSIHEEIVNQIDAYHQNGADPEERARRALRDMDAKGALQPGDSALLEDMIQASLSDQPGKTPEQLLEGVREVASRIKSHAASPACRAVAETADQSGTRAVNLHQSETAPAGWSGATLWRKLVWPDIEGAYCGGAAAAASVAPMLSIYPFAWPLQLTAALGVIVGSGLLSGAAYGQRMS